jgi:6-phosphogluconolactonase
MRHRSNLSRFGALAVPTLAAGVLALSGTVGAAAQSQRHDEDHGTLVYTQDNATAGAGGNHVHAFRLGAGGALTSIGSFATGGAGSGSGLGSQGAVTLADGGHALLAVNAASNTLTVFRVTDDGTLKWRDVASSGGSDPISVTAHGDLIEVLNAGSNTVSGLELSDHSLTPITGAVALLSGGATAPVQVGFTPDGEHVVVAEKVSNTIDTFEVSGDRLRDLETTTVTGTATPFGFDFSRRGDLIISDAAGGAPGASATTSYRIDDSGRLHAINEAASGQSAACWVVVNHKGDRAYVANTGSGSVSSYNISGSGALSLRVGAAATPGGHPVDEALGGGWFFVLIGQAIAATPVLPSGDLGSVTSTGGLPAGTTGLAARATS